MRFVASTDQRNAMCPMHRNCGKWWSCFRTWKQRCLYCTIRWISWFGPCVSTIFRYPHPKYFCREPSPSHREHREVWYCQSGLPWFCSAVNLCIHTWDVWGRWGGLCETHNAAFATNGILNTCQHVFLGHNTFLCVNTMSNTTRYFTWYFIGTGACNRH